MFLPAFHDLLKPQWLAVLTELKISGGLAIPELCRRLGQSYMTLKQHCEQLAKLGYLQRSRVPRTGIGRPEIFYRLSPKADALFPPVPVSFTLDILEQIRLLFGENAPDRLLFLHFQKLEALWQDKLAKAATLPEKAALLAKLREKEGLFVRLIESAGQELVLREFHNPLRPVFEAYPRAIQMETRAIEAALQTRLTRRDENSSHTDFILHHRP